MSKGTNIVGLDLNIDGDYLEEAVRQTVIAGISESLNGKNEIVSQLVSSVLKTKCKPDGTISNYERDNTCTLLEAYVRTTIKKIAREELADIIEESRPEIKKQVRKAISNAAKQGEIVEAFLNALISDISNAYRTTVDVSFTKEKEW